MTRRKWAVALYNVHAQCGIVGPECLTRDQAFLAAKARAGETFLNYRGGSLQTPLAFYNEEWPTLRNLGRAERRSISNSGRSYTLELRRA